MSLIGADVGGGGCKAAAFDQDGRMLAYAYEAYGQLRPRPSWLEFDLEAQWQALQRVLRQVATAPGLRGDPPRTLSLSAAGDAVVPVDREMRQLYPSIASPDERGREEGEWLAARLGGVQRLYELTGQPLDNMYALNRVIWTRTQMPEVYRHTWKWLCWGDFFLGKLGLPPTIDWSLAARTLGFDLINRQWSAEVLGVAEISTEQLADVAPSGSVVGPIPRRIADDLSLPAGVLGVVGGFDQACAALGAGADRPGIASIGTGSVEAFAVPIARPLLGPAATSLWEAGIPQVPHAGPDVYFLVSYHFAAGSLVRWYRDAFAAEERQDAERLGQNVFDAIDAGLPSEPTDLLALPHFAGAFVPTRDPHSSGALLGLNLRTSRQEVARALLEGTAYELRRIAQLFTDREIRIEELRAVGGGARSDAWVQIKADVLGRPISRPAEVEAGCLAGAILGAVALGLHADVGAAVDAMVHVARTFEPDSRRAAQYEQRFALYRDLYPALAPFSHRLAALARERTVDLEV